MTPLTKISGDGRVAVRYGMEEAVFLDALMFWYRTNRGDNRNYRDGRWWSHNSVKAYEQVFPWWTAKQIRRVIESCKNKGALLAGNYNTDRRDRTFWYTPSDELLELYGETVLGNCNFPNGQMQSPEQAESFAQTGEPLPCTTHVETDMIPPVTPQRGDSAGKQSPKRLPKTVPKYQPVWFERFWQLYPRRTNRAAAVKAWDKLRPDLELCKVMADAIRAQKQTAQWQDGPDHIPHPSTWLNGARWTDEVTPAAKSGGWADDPEVY